MRTSNMVLRESIHGCSFDAACEEMCDEIEDDGLFPDMIPILICKAEHRKEND